MSAWGSSWGESWASSWGGDAPIPPVVLIDTHDESPRRNRKYREKQESLRRQISEAIDPPVSQVVELEAVQILPSRTEYVAIHEPAEDEDEMAIVMELA